MEFDYSKLNGRIVEKCKTQDRFALLMGLSHKTISLRLNNKTAFKQDEINRATEILNISNNEVQDYFFTPKVQKI